MNHITVTAEIIPDKREEFIQVVRSVNKLFKKEKGFKSSVLYQDVENPSCFNLIQEWASQDDMDVQLRSETFRVLMGALKLLTRHSKIEYNLVSDQSDKKVLVG